MVSSAFQAVFGFVMSRRNRRDRGPSGAEQAPLREPSSDEDWVEPAEGLGAREAPRRASARLRCVRPWSPASGSGTRSPAIRMAGRALGISSHSYPKPLAPTGTSSCSSGSRPARCPPTRPVGFKASANAYGRDACRVLTFIYPVSMRRCRRGGLSQSWNRRRWLRGGWRARRRSSDIGVGKFGRQLRRFLVR